VKTAISIPDPTFDAAEQLASRLGMSRSELYATAVAEYVKVRLREDVTARLNEVYAEEESEVDAVVQALQLRSLPDTGERW